MTSFGRTKVKKTSKSDQVYRIRESLFSKGLQGYTRVSLAIKKIPDDEAYRLKNIDSTPFINLAWLIWHHIDTKLAEKALQK